MSECTVEGCGRKHFGKGFCSAHFSRKWRTGEVRAHVPIGSMSGEHSKNWNGGITKTKDGRIMVFSPNHPNAYKNGYMLRSRLVVEKQLGRKLTPSEDVHHINEIKDDDRPENLEVLSHSDHGSRIHSNRRKSCAKLTPEKADSIRREYATGKFSQRNLASRFGIAQGTIRPLLKGKTWKQA